jgi:beta-mannanase
LLTRYNTSLLQLGLWLVDSLEDVNSGDLDNEIYGLIDFVNAAAPSSVLIRIGYEFDSSENHYEPQQFVKAFRRIVNMFRALGVRNAGFVWHSVSSADLSVPLPVSSWYPGDGYVDW